jgi:hypothetical protein
MTAGRSGSTERPVGAVVPLGGLEFSQAVPAMPIGFIEVSHDQRIQSTSAAPILPACSTEAMQLNLDEIAIKITLGLTPFFSSRMACPGPQGPQQHLPLAAPAPPVRAQRTRKHLAIHAAELAVKSFSNLSTTLSISAATPGTRSSISRGKSCPPRRDWAVVGHSI